MAEAAGYVIQGYGNRFVSRTGRYVKHSNRRRVTGAERSWAHSLDFVLNGGDWAQSARLVIPAHYDREKDLTILDGEGVPYAEFVKKHS